MIRQFELQSRHFKRLLPSTSLHAYVSVYTCPFSLSPSMTLLRKHFFLVVFLRDILTQKECMLSSVSPCLSVSWWQRLGKDWCLGPCTHFSQVKIQNLSSQAGILMKMIMMLLRSLRLRILRHVTKINQPSVFLKVSFPQQPNNEMLRCDSKVWAWMGTSPERPQGL